MAAEGYAPAHPVTAEDMDFPLQAHCEVCHVRPGEFEGFGRGMRCMEKVKQGEELLAVPTSKCWTAAAARRCPEIVALGDEVLECLSDQTLIVLHLLVVKAQGPAAEDFRREHVAYLESLGSETLLDWEEEDLQMLSGSKWAMVAPTCKQDIEQEFMELNEVLEDFFAVHAIDSEKFCWAHRILISRMLTFFNEDGSTMHVLAFAFDLFNHSVDVPVGSTDVQLRQSDTGEQLLTVFACKDYAVDEQAFISYSAASNGRLLMMGNFVVPENPFDSVELMLTFPVTAESLPCYLTLAESLRTGLCKPGVAAAEATKAEFLETLPPEAEEPTDVALHIHLSRSVLVEQLERVLAFLRLQQLCKGGAAPTPAELSASDSDMTGRMQSLRSLRAIVTSLLQQYPRTLEDDQCELNAAGKEAQTGDQRAQRKAMALRVLVGEKQILVKANEVLEQKLQES